MKNMSRILRAVLLASCLSACSGADRSDNDPNVGPGSNEANRLPASPQVLTAQEIASQSFPSVVLLTMSDANGQPVSLGSGFFVADDLVATNAHVVEGAATGLAKPISQTATMQISGIAGIDAEKDIALLRVHGRGPALTLAEPAAVGETIFAIGNPEGFEGTFSQGIVSGVRNVGESRFLQITAPISPGSSGGPVLNDKGQVIGIATATYRRGQNLNFAMPAEYVRQVLSGPLSDTPLASGTRRPRALVEELGEASTSGLVGENFQWDNDYDFQGGGFTLSIRNQLDRAVEEIYVLAIFHDRQGRPIEVVPIVFPGTIPAGLARRVSGLVDSSIMSLTTPETRRSGTAYARSPNTRLDIRVLRFAFAQ